MTTSCKKMSLLNGYFCCSAILDSWGGVGWRIDWDKLYIVGGLGNQTMLVGIGGLVVRPH